MDKIMLAKVARDRYIDTTHIYTNTISLQKFNI